MSQLTTSAIAELQMEYFIRDEETLGDVLMCLASPDEDGNEASPELIKDLLARCDKAGVDAKRAIKLAIEKRERFMDAFRSPKTQIVSTRPFRVPLAYK